jgi:hypothetical protein
MPSMRGKRILLVLGLFILSVGFLQLLLCPTSLDQPSSESDKIDETMANSVAQSAFQSQFYENKGQVNTKDVMFYGRVPGGMIGFGVSRISLRMDGTDSCVYLSFEGASNVTPMGLNAVSRHTSYFLGDRGTYTGIREYSRITYEDLWPGIDLHYYVTVDGVKYEFHVAAGRNPNDIRVRCEGHDSLVIGESMLSISKGNGTFVDEGLRAFQDLTDVDVRFSSYGSDTFGFKVGDYNKSKDLIIDPLVYSTFIGGSSYDSARSIAVDSSGNAYVTGSTQSSEFPTVNAYNSTYGGGDESGGDCFVLKISADGSTLLYSTFIGGTGPDVGRSIAVDSSGFAYITGNTKSPDFPTANAYNSTYGGGEDWWGGGDCFVFKLSADGSTLLYSTFIGGSNDDWGSSIAVDSSGNAYVTGITGSLDFPTVNAYNSTHGGEWDCFVFRLSADGSILLYSTFVGGTGEDWASSIALDLSGNAFVAGYTESPDFPMVNAYSSTYGGEWDCFVFKLSADGSTLLYSTFIGGREYDWVSSVAVDSSGNAYVTGGTLSPDFPTVNAYNSTHGGEWDCFVFRLSADGSILLYSTFVGGTGQDWASSIALDLSGNAFVAGITDSSDFPTVNAYNSTYGGGGGCFLCGESDSFVFKLSADGSTLLYSTFIGGNGFDEAYSIAVDSSGNAYVTGATNSPNFPTKNAYNSTYGGDGSHADYCFVLKLGFYPSYYTSVVFGIPAVVSGILQQLQEVLPISMQDYASIIYYAVEFGILQLPMQLLQIISIISIYTATIGTFAITIVTLQRPLDKLNEILDRRAGRRMKEPDVSIVRVPVVYTLLSRLRESRWNILRREKELE